MLGTDEDGAVTQLRAFLARTDYPPNGRLPLLTSAAVQRWEAQEATSHGRGEGDSYIDRSLTDRCIESFAPGRVGNWGLGDPPVDRAVKGIGVDDPVSGLPAAAIRARLWSSFNAN